MSKQETTDSDRIWQQLVEEYSLWAQVLKEFFSKETDRIAILQRAFKKGDIAPALHVMQYMAPDELTTLFDELIHFSTSHGYAGSVREIILSLPRNWVLSNIEKTVEPHLVGATEDEYRRFLELYLLLDKDLTQRLIQRAINHPDNEIREVGRDFQNSLH